MTDNVLYTTISMPWIQYKERYAEQYFKLFLDPIDFTPIDKPIPFPPMGNGFETVIIIQSTDGDPEIEMTDSSKANGLTTGKNFLTLLCISWILWAILICWQAVISLNLCEADPKLNFVDLTFLKRLMDCKKCQLISIISKYLVLDYQIWRWTDL